MVICHLGVLEVKPSPAKASCYSESGLNMSVTILQNVALTWFLVSLIIFVIFLLILLLLLLPLAFAFSLCKRTFNWPKVRGWTEANRSPLGAEGVSVGLHRHFDWEAKPGQINSGNSKACQRPTQSKIPPLPSPRCRGRCATTYLPAEEKNATLSQQSLLLYKTDPSLGLVLLVAHFIFP